MSDYHDGPRIDSKGKYYTRVVSTQGLDVIIQTHSGQSIQGSLHLQPNRRLSDELNDGGEFLSVTGAVVSQASQELYRASFISVNRLAIQWVIPVQAIGETVEEMDG